MNLSTFQLYAFISGKEMDEIHLNLVPQILVQESIFKFKFSFYSLFRKISFFLLMAAINFNFHSTKLLTVNLITVFQFGLPSKQKPNSHDKSQRYKTFDCCKSETRKSHQDVTCYHFQTLMGRGANHLRQLNSSQSYSSLPWNPASEHNCLYYCVVLFCS